MITTLPSTSPKNNVSVPTNLDKTDLGKPNVANEDGNKTNCDTEPPQNCQEMKNVASEPSNMEVKDNSATECNLNSSSDGSSTTLKKIYKSDMI